jgi:hypothetical protein
VHRSTIHKKKKKKFQQDATMYQNFIIPYFYEGQHVSGDTPPIIRTLKLHWHPLVFHTWKVLGPVVAWQRPPTARPTTFHVWKTRGCQCSFMFLMMGGVSPETCWASYKYGIVKFWYSVASCWIFLHELFLFPFTVYIPISQASYTRSLSCMKCLLSSSTP